MLYLPTFTQTRKYPVLIKSDPPPPSRSLRAWWAHPPLSGSRGVATWPIHHHSISKFCFVFEHFCICHLLASGLSPNNILISGRDPHGLQRPTTSKDLPRGHVVMPWCFSPRPFENFRDGTVDAPQLRNGRRPSHKAISKGIFHWSYQEWHMKLWCLLDPDKYIYIYINSTYCGKQTRQKTTKTVCFFVFSVDHPKHPSKNNQKSWAVGQSLAWRGAYSRDLCIISFLLGEGSMVTEAIKYIIN